MALNFTVNHLSPLLSLIFGILILINPKLLSVLIGIYLIIVGLIGLGILHF
ncbi:MAG: DUF3096 domain-containing protein [Patescibacteria group bacterium]|nr:DUF3096 domain-containing protein [Patescibacteria group bacterium]